VRGQPGGGLLGQDHPPPAEPRRRPPSQQRPVAHHPDPTARRSRHPRLRPAANHPGQDHQGLPALPQALHRREPFPRSRPASSTPTGSPDIGASNHRGPAPGALPRAHPRTWHGHPSGPMHLPGTVVGGFGPHALTWHGGQRGSPHPVMGCGQPDPPIPVMGYPPGWGPGTEPEGCGAGAAESRRAAGPRVEARPARRTGPGTAGSRRHARTGRRLPGPRRDPAREGPPCPVRAWGPNPDHRARYLHGARRVTTAHRQRWWTRLSTHHPRPAATSRGCTRRGRRRWGGACRCPWVGACGVGRRGPWPR
jgi:hypothetical protein